MTDYLRRAWYEIYHLAASDYKTTYIIGGIVVITIGIICLRGNVIKS